jgi:uncharacterized membrane protein YhhN
MYWLYAFWAMALMNVGGEYLQNNTLIWLSKPLLMPFLLGWLMSVSPKPPRFLYQMVLVSLCLATLGDVLLLFARGADGQLFFMTGLGAFLLAHICYIISFKSIPVRYQTPVIPIIFLMLLSFVLMRQLWPGLPDTLRIAVGLYAFTITLMGIFVLRLYKSIPNQVFFMLMGGALLFIGSDSMIALNKFSAPIPQAGVLIMATYILGQYFIVRGVRHLVEA